MGSSILLWWLGGAAAIALGSVAAFWALWGRRLAQRDRPRCPKCRYDMTGVTGLTCPECGRTAKSPWALTHAPRRWAMASLAVAMIVAGLATPAAGYLRGGNYSILPTPWLITLWRYRPTSNLTMAIITSRAWDTPSHDAMLARACADVFGRPGAWDNGNRRPPLVTMHALALVGHTTDPDGIAAGVVAAAWPRIPTGVRSQVMRAFDPALNGTRKRSPLIVDAARLSPDGLRPEQINDLVQGPEYHRARVARMLAGTSEDLRAALGEIDDDDEGVYAELYPTVVGIALDHARPPNDRWSAWNATEDAGPQMGIALAARLPEAEGADAVRAIYHLSRRDDDVPPPEVFAALARVVEDPARPFAIREMAAQAFELVVLRGRKAPAPPTPTLAWYAPVWPPSTYAPAPGSAPAPRRPARHLDFPGE